MCVLSDCVVRIETELWVIRLHYLCEKACVPNCSNLRPYDCIWTVALSCLRVINLTRGHSACMATWPAVDTGQWPLGTNSAQFTVYRLKHSCQTARAAARPIPEGMTIFCLVSFTTGAVRSAMPATAGFLVVTCNAYYKAVFHIAMNNKMSPNRTAAFKKTYLGSRPIQDNKKLANLHLFYLLTDKNACFRGTG